MQTVEIISPVNGKIFTTKNYLKETEAENVIHAAHIAQQKWKNTAIDTRIEIVQKFINFFEEKSVEICEELTWLMGRPKKQNLNEINGFKDRANYLIEISKESLNNYLLPEKENFKRFIKREPLGVILVIAPWNYPYLCMVNSVVPAILAGNSIIVKQSPQTFPCAERFAEAFKTAGLPDNVYQFLHVNHDVADKVIKNLKIQFVQFTGSVRGGKEVLKSVGQRFIGTGFELGGKDPAYVREDADVDYAAENLIDGAFYNSGQSCCAVERVYVHEKVYDKFVSNCVELTKKNYKLGDPNNKETNLGPVINAAAAAAIRSHITDAVTKGATNLIEENLFPSNKVGTAYIAPAILVNVNHNMKVMMDETFGPVLPIQKVSSDEEAVRLMNDSEYGLTASIWTKDEKKAFEIGEKLETGTVFMNRCDCLDPGLAWSGVKNSGRGVSLSKYGFDAVTRPKSFHFRVKH
ncbi:hypothetical protein HK099_003524 [Clydaea vesicula]|uniref:Aldehyde dehydrogenase domain-containing protein n=1 Tax=Clydaea vesicula TaxID=447962 RepID=A0AAD5UAB3_9FUNG|nr:hypothetical protein HK099_003524 [Clydaea vesicula]